MATFTDHFIIVEKMEFRWKFTYTPNHELKATLKGIDVYKDREFPVVNGCVNKDVLNEAEQAWVRKMWIEIRYGEVSDDLFYLLDPIFARLQKEYIQEKPLEDHKSDLRGILFKSPGDEITFYQAIEQEIYEILNKQP